MTEIISHLIQSTLFAAAAWLLILSMRRNRARTRYAIWLTASLKFLVPFALLISAGAHLRWRIVPAIPQRAKDLVWEQAGSTVGSALVPYLRVNVQQPNDPGGTAELILLAIWFAGFAFVLIRHFAEWRRVAALVRSGRPFPQRAPLLIIPIVACRESIEPGAFGLFRPVLLLPEDIADTLTPVQLDAVIAHEIFHINRRDNLTSSLHMLVEAVFWFHPIVWWIGARLVEERERACDEAVVESGSAPHAYAEGILNICKHYLHQPSACVAGVAGSDLRQRIEQIMSHRAAQNLRAGKKLALLLAGCAAIAVPVFIGMVNAQRLLAQTPAAATARLAFTAASVKPDSPGAINTGTVRVLPGGRLTAERAVLRFFIQNAYGLKSFQIAGGPGWINSDGYDIEARAEGNPTASQMRLMMQNLLEDRFKLKAHLETRELPVYTLTLEKGGIRSLSRKGAPCITPERNDLMPPRPPCPGEIYCGRPLVGVSPSGASLQGDQVSIAELARVLSNVLGRTVIDKTGFTGALDFKLQFAIDDTLQGLPGRPPASAGSPDDSIFSALREQLGLQLKPDKGPVEVLVIDHVDRPTEN